MVHVKSEVLALSVLHHERVMARELRTLCGEEQLREWLDEATLEIVNQIPAVKAGVWKQEMMPIFMGKGSIDREEE